jgi:hypothetical protein
VTTLTPLMSAYALYGHSPRLGITRSHGRVGLQKIEKMVRKHESARALGRSKLIIASEASISVCKG